jgi:hypothetical protein
MEAQYSPSLVPISVSLLATQGKARGTLFRQDMRQRCSGCQYAFFSSTLDCLHPVLSIRTDKAVLAVNGFAADANVFVKKVKQRLEVRTSSFLEHIHIPHSHSVVPSRSCKGHAYSRHRQTDSDHALFEALFPLLRLQHPWWHRRRWSGDPFIHPSSAQLHYRYRRRILV